MEVLKSLNSWQDTKFGKLKIKYATNYAKGSHKKVIWVCDCGREKEIIISNVTRGLTTSCGHCNEVYIDQTKKFGKLRIKYPKTIFLKSEKEIEWICDCGKEITIKICYVTNLDTTSCGRCNEISSEELKEKKFGALRLEMLKDLKPFSHEKLRWVCDCGNKTEITVFNVTRGLTKSCGKCREKIDEWYMKNKEILQSLKPPIIQLQIPDGPFKINETITNTGKPFSAVCPVCKNEYKPLWDNIRYGRALTCGCRTNHSSLAQKEISSFIESLGVITELEYEVNGLSYDIFVPSANLLIEYNGLKWHSGEEARRRDFNKYQNATSSGYSYLMIFEDEWLYYQDKVKNLFKNKLIKSNPISLRPSKVEIRQINSDLTNPFYDSFHYIGRCNAKVHYGVFFEERLIGAMSFSHPTRQHIKHPFELIRMASDPEFRVHGIWSKLLKQFISEYSPSSIVSFSDNRLFSGGVYEKIGFKLDGEIRSDYYWVKNQRRFHKSGLRKTKEERLTGLTETVLREAQGYKKIWDLGKKRWIFMNSLLS